MTPDMPTARTSQARESNLNLVQSSEVFDEEVVVIEEVHCESQLFELELSGHLPRVNVKGNLRIFGSALKPSNSFLTLYVTVS